MEGCRGEKSVIVLLKDNPVLVTIKMKKKIDLRVQTTFSNKEKVEESKIKNPMKFSMGSSDPIIQILIGQEFTKNP